MADIKQAGVWLEEGKAVRRSTWKQNSRIAGQSGFPSLIALFWNEGRTKCEGEFVLSTSDLTTDDWEIAE